MLDISERQFSHQGETGGNHLGSGLADDLKQMSVIESRRHRRKLCLDEHQTRSVLDSLRVGVGLHIVAANQSLDASNCFGVIAHFTKDHIYLFGVARLLISAPAQVGSPTIGIAGSGYFPSAKVMCPGRQQQRFIGRWNKPLHPLRGKSTVRQGQGAGLSAHHDDGGVLCVRRVDRGAGNLQALAQTAHSDSPTAATNGPVSSKSA